MSKREQFIIKANAIHNNFYDYSLVEEYKNNKCKVTIICPNHGNYQTTVQTHLKGSKCPKCNKKTGKKDTNTFIKEAKEIHGDKYNYDKVVYTTNKNKVIITCSIHGDFEQVAKSHILGFGCKKCGLLNNTNHKKHTTEDFIKNSINFYGDDKFDYSKTIYKKSDEKLTLICKLHNFEFEQIAGDHLRYNGCKNCVNNKKYTTEEYIEKCIEIHGNDKYDYRLTEYYNANTNINIICKLHNITFNQKPNSHLYKNIGCPKCKNNNNINDNTKLTTKEFIEKAIEVHGDKYDYNNVNYINNYTKVEIICKIHGIFEQYPKDHVYKKCNCPLCVYKTEGKLFLKLKEKYNNVKFEFTIDECKKIRLLKFDFLLQDYNIIIELDGTRHFIDIDNWGNCYKDVQETDKYKRKIANENNYSMIRIYQPDVLNNNIDCNDKLDEYINKIIERGGVYNCYISKNKNTYLNYIEDDIYYLE